MPIGVHEFIYPLMQGYDSVVLDADVELGALIRNSTCWWAPFAARIQPRTAGGHNDAHPGRYRWVQKMSKSLGNYIGVNDEAYEMPGKTMSIPDQLICRYFELLTGSPWMRSGLWKRPCRTAASTRDAKIRLAKELITMYHNAAEADKAEERFKLVFSQGKSRLISPKSRLNPGRYGFQVPARPQTGSLHQWGAVPSAGRGTSER